MQMSMYEILHLLIQAGNLLLAFLAYFLKRKE